MLTLRTLAGVALAALVASGTWTAPVHAQHQHHHRAPHGGTLIELGHEDAHLEIVVDRLTGGIAVYVLDGEAERAVKVAQPELDVHVNGPNQSTPVHVVLRAAANVLTGEAVGHSSQFTGRHPVFKTAGVLRGTIGPVTVRGAAYKALAFVIAETPARQ